jgi:type VI secretion system protein ImpM
MKLASDVATIPGWYGKLPSLGDFASRRLEADFIEPWDLWLGEAMQAQRDVMGDGWLDAYLQSPPWRFVLMQGVLPGFDPNLVLAGVLMPSVDRVGRYFPLTIAASFGGLPASNVAYEGLLAWLHRLEDTALDALQDDWTIEQLEAALAGLAPPSSAPPEASSDPLAPIRSALAEALAGAGSFVAIEGISSRTELASLLVGMVPAAAIVPAAPSIAIAPLTGRALWLADNPDYPQLLVSKGLPANEDFIRMFGSTGREPGAETIY